MTRNDFIDRMKWIRDDINEMNQEMTRVRSDVEVLTLICIDPDLEKYLTEIDAMLAETGQAIEQACTEMSEAIWRFKTGVDE